MTPTDQKENQWDWLFRILVTADLLLIVLGYIAWFQTKRQLISPLIPKNTVAQVWIEGYGYRFEAALAIAACMLCGLWFYSFKKKGIELLFLAAGPVIYLLYETVI
ncbi:MAG TPA: hypothetical protein VF476_17985 [Chitinophagaceae bacterium]